MNKEVKLINQEAGFGQPANDVLRKPMVTKDSRGRVSWSIPGNSDEENRQLGIRNIQALFLEGFPEFNELFPRGENGLTKLELRDNASKFVTQSVESSENFRKLFHSGSLRTPYFNKRYQYVLQQVFGEWGLELHFPTKPRRGYEGSAKLYWTEQTIEEESKKFYEEFGQLSFRFMYKRRPDLAGAIRFYEGGLLGLKKKLNINTSKPPNYWSIQKILEEAGDFYARYHDIREKFVRSQGRGDLAAYINKYPGGMRQLRKDLGIQSPRRESGYWSADNVRKEAMDFYKIHGTLSLTLVTELKRFDLLNGISSYPGGMLQLRMDLGINIIRKNESYWTTDRILTEAEEFIKKYGGISTSLLVKYKRNDLKNAIRKYLGGWEVLNLRLESREKDKIIFQDAREELEALMEVVEDE